MLEIDYTDRFIDDLAAMSYREGERVERAIFKFQNSPNLPGLNFEKLKGFENLWSIRVNKSVRCLMSREQGLVGEVWRFHTVGPHDIYKEARRMFGSD